MGEERERWSECATCRGINSYQLGREDYGGVREYIRWFAIF